MVAIFTGLGAGAERGSGNVLGGAGLLGGASLGRSAEQVLLNATTGNLMIQQKDEMLVGVGPDASVARTYNSRGDLSDENGDNWRQSTDRRVYGLTGTLNQASSTIKRVSADGSEITYSYQSITRTIGTTTQTDTGYFATDGSGAYDKLTWSAAGGGSWTWTDGDSQLTETYGQVSGSQWLITKQTDTSGNALTFSYVTGTSHLDKVVVTDKNNTNAQYIQYSWSGNNITQVTTGYQDYVAAAAETLTRTRYTYDAYNRLKTVVVDLSPEDNSIADGKAYTTTYNYKTDSGADMHLVSSIAETDGSLLTIGYDSSQRVTSLVQTVATGITRTTTINYVSTTRTTVTDATGQVTTLDYDANGNLTTITAPPAAGGIGSQVTKFTYNATGDVTSVTDPLGNTTTYAGFTAYGDATTITDPLAYVTTRTYGFKNELLTETVSGVDKVTDTITDTANDHTTHYIYDGNDRLAFEVSPSGNVVEHRYDGLGREWLTLTYTGATANPANWTFYDLTQWVSNLSDPTAVDQRQFTYDDRGNIKNIIGYGKSTAPGSGATANGYSYTDYIYDQAGQLTSRKDYNHNAETFVYDGLGRMVASVDLQLSTTRVLFDDANAKTIVTLANGLSQISTYNRAGELVAYTQSSVPTGATNLAPDLSNASQWGKGNVTWGPAGMIAGAPATQFTTGTGGGSLSTGPIAVAAGDTLTWEVTLKGVPASLGVNETLSDTFGFYGNGGLGNPASGWGDTVNTTATVISGPGSLTSQYYSLWKIDNLSTTVETRVRITRTFAQAENVYGFFYVKTSSGGTAGDSVIMASPSIFKTTAADPQVTAATSQYFYDQLGRVRMVTDATQHNSYMIYDNAGRKVGDVDNYGQLTEYRYDADNHVVATIRYSTLLSATQIAALKNTTASFDLATNRPNPANGDLWTFNVYDKDGRTIEVIDGAGDATAYSYDASGKLIATTAYANKLSAVQLAALKGLAGENLRPDLSNASQWSLGGLNPPSGTGPYTFTGTGAGGTLWAGNFTVAVGDTLSFEVTLRGAGSPATLTDAVGIYAGGSGWGDGSDVTATILSGPGAITKQNSTIGPGVISGLQTNADTRIRVTRTFTTATTASVFFYLKAASGATVNDAVILSAPSVIRTPTSVLTLPAADGAHDKTSRIFYDETGRVVGTLDGEGYLSTVTYDAGGFKVTETAYAAKAANGATASFATLAAATNAADRTTHYVYDNQGLLCFVIDAQNHVTEYVYPSLSLPDVIGKSRRTIQYAGTITAPTSWTVASIRTAINAVSGLATNSDNRSTWAIYDSNTEYLDYSIDATGAVTRYKYDAMGHVIKVTRYAASYPTPTQMPNSGDLDGWANSTTIANNPDNRTSRNLYDARGNLTYSVDGESYVTRYDYDGEDRLIGTARWNVVVGGIDDTKAANDIPGLIATAMAGTSPTPTVITTATSYDMDGRVDTTTDGENVVTKYVYNYNGTLQSQTVAYNTPDAVQTYYVYDGAGRVLSRSDAYGSADVAVTQFEYDAFGDVSASTDPNNVRHTYNYDRAGNLLSKTDQENLTTSYQYNAFGEVMVTTDPLLNKSYTYYDILGRVIATRDADNRVTATGYDFFGEVKSVTRYANPTGQVDTSVAPTYGTSGPSLLDTARDAVTTYVYDKDGRLQTTTDAEGGFTTITYNAFGEIGLQIDSLGTSTTIQTTYTYDRRGLLKQQVVDSASGGKAITTGYGYDGFGRQTSLTNALTKGSSATYDKDGRLKSRTDPLGNTTSYTYDKRGNLVATTDAVLKVTRYVYDSQDRLIATIDPLGAVTVNSYDANGNLVLTQAYATNVSLAGQPTQVTSALYAALAGTASRATHFVYDKDGRLRFTIDALGQVTENVYDADDNIVRVVQYNGAITPTAFTVTAIGALVSGLSGRGTRAVYDAANQLIYSIDAVGQVTRNTYDALGRVVRTTEFYKLYTDTATPPLTTMDSWAGNASNIDALHDRVTRSWYDRNGLLRYSMDAAKYVTRYDYDRAGNVTKQTVFADANSTADATLDNPALTTTVTLDAAYPSSSATAQVTTFGYDTAGRLTTTTNWIDGPSGANTVAITRTLELDALGQILSSTAASNTGDASKTSFLYDDAGRMVRKISADLTVEASTEYYYYDTLGRRVATVDGDGYLCVWGYDDVDNLTSEKRYGNPISAAIGMSLATLQGLAGTAADDATTTTYYNAFGDATRTVDPRGNETLAFYDNLGRVTRQVDAERFVTDTTYTRGGQVATVTRRQAGGNTWPADGTSWSAIGATNPTAAGTIDGSNAYTLKPQANGTPGYVQSAGTGVAAGRTVTFSFWISKGTLSSASFGINAVTGGWGAALDTSASIVSGAGTLSQTSGGLWSISGLDSGGAATLIVITRKFTAADTATARIYAGSSTSSALTTDSVIVADPLFTGGDAVTSFTYDNDDRLTSTTDAEGYTESYTLDAFGQRIEVRNKLNGTVVDGVTLNTTSYYEFDKRGLLTKETLPVATQTTANIVNTYQYDARGNRTQMVEASGASEQRTTNYSYDKLDRLIRTEHDQVDTITLTDSGLISTVGVTPVETVAYDARGNVIERDQASKVGGTTTAYSRTLYWYDDLDRATTMLVQTDATSGVLTTYGYDKNGNRTRATTYAATAALPGAPGGPAPVPSGSYRQTIYTYDRANRLKSTKVAALVVGSWTGADASSGNFAVTTEDVTTSVTYDRDGNVISQTDGRLNSSYTWYDRLGRAIAEVDAENYMTVWTRDAEGNATSEIRYGRKLDPFVPGATPPTPTPTGLDRTTRFTYDNNGRRLTETRTGVEWRAVAGDGTLGLNTNSDATITYTYNGLGEVLSKTEANSDTTRYKYDKIGRLTLKTDQAFIDVNGQSATPRTAFTYDGLNNLLTTRVQVDATGTNSNDRLTTYSYGAGGRLASVTDAANNSHTYGYDVAGRQVLDRYTRKLSNGSNADPEAQVLRYDVAGRVITQTTARLSGSTWVFTDSSGAKYDAVRMRYDVFGEMTGRGITAGPAATAVYQEVFDYDAGGRLWHSNSGDGVDRFYLYDKAGNQTLTLASAGADLSAYAAGTSSYSSLISSSGSIAAAGGINNLNATTTITIYDKRGQALFVRAPDRQLTAGSAVTSITTGKTYNAFGEVLSETEARGFDASGNPVSGYTTNYIYNVMGKLVTKYQPIVSVTRANGSQSTISPTENYYYDISGRLIAVEDADSADSSTHYYTTRLLLAGTGHGNSGALVTQEFDREGGSTKTGYDVFGDARSSSALVNIVGGVSNWRTTLSDYDKLSQLITVTHPTVLAGAAGNNDFNQTTHYDQQLVDHYTYDLLGQRITHSQNWSENGVAKARTERMDYDYKGRVVSTVGYAGDAMTYAYSEFDTSKVTAGLGTFGGWTKTTTNGTAARSEWEVDDYFGRTIDSQDYDKTGDSITPYNYDYTFNKAGQLVARSNNASANNGGTVSLVNEGLTFSYLNTGLAAGQDGTQGTATYSYDVAGNRVAEIFAKGGVNYRSATAQFDALGRMTQWDDGSIAVGGTGSVTTNPIETKWEYDASGNVRVARTFYRPINQNGGFDPIVSPAREEWYSYDKMGRVKISQGIFTGTAGSGTISRGDDGIGISYYLDGNRLSTTTTNKNIIWSGWRVTLRHGGGTWFADEDPDDPLIYTTTRVTKTYSGDQQETYIYSADGQLAEVDTAQEGYYLSGTTVTGSNSMGGTTASVTIDRDAVGRISHYLESSSKGTYERKGVSYDAADREQGETTITIHANVIDTAVITNTYQDGLLSHQDQHNYSAPAGSSTPTDSTADSAAPDTSQDYTYAWWDGPLQSTQTYHDGAGHNWTTTFVYDGSGHVTQAQIQDGQPRNANYVTDQNGMVIDRQEVRTNGSATGMPREVHYLFGGIQLGQVGNNGTGNVPYAASIATRLASPVGQPGMFANGSTQATPFADFDQNYDAINGASVVSTASTYTVQGGETLGSIAQTLWGDANLWYLIADVNGLSASGTLAAGTVLTIPAKVVDRANTSDTFRPYDPNEALGDNSPTRAPTPPKPKKGACGVFGQILQSIVTIAVAIVLAPTIGLVPAAMVGNAAGQLFGMATGIQQGGFSFKSVAIAGVTALVTAGVGQVLGDGAMLGSQFLGDVVRGVAANAITQGIGVATHLQDSFDWAGVAMAGIAAGVGGAVTRGIVGPVDSHGSLIHPLGRLEGYGVQLVSGMAGGVAGAAARSLITGTDFGDNIKAVLPDVIGQTLAGAIAGAISSKSGGAKNSLFGEAEEADTHPTSSLPSTSSGTADAPRPDVSNTDKPDDIIVTGTRTSGGGSSTLESFDGKLFRYKGIVVGGFDITSHAATADAIRGRTAPVKVTSIGQARAIDLDNLRKLRIGHGTNDPELLAEVNARLRQYDLEEEWNITPDAPATTKPADADVREALSRLGSIETSPSRVPDPARELGNSALGGLSVRTITGIASLPGAQLAAQNVTLSESALTRLVKTPVTASVFAATVVVTVKLGEWQGDHLPGANGQPYLKGPFSSGGTFGGGGAPLFPTFGGGLEPTPKWDRDPGFTPGAGPLQLPGFDRAPPPQPLPGLTPGSPSQPTPGFRPGPPAQLPVGTSLPDNPLSPIMTSQSTSGDWDVPQAAKDKIPSAWGDGRDNKKSGTGMRWQDPNDKGNHVRIDHGNPNSIYPSQQVDHVVISSRGVNIGRDGRPINGSIKQDPVNAHIPLSDWLEWNSWNRPN